MKEEREKEREKERERERGGQTGHYALGFLDKMLHTRSTHIFSPTIAIVKNSFAKALPELDRNTLSHQVSGK